MHAISDPEELNLEQRELISAAAENRGRLAVRTQASTQGRAVFGKHRTFFDVDDREFATRFVETLPTLEKLLLMRQAGGRGEYELTNFGWQISRKLS